MHQEPEIEKPPKASGGIKSISELQSRTSSGFLSAVTTVAFRLGWCADYSQRLLMLSHNMSAGSALVKRNEPYLRSRTTCWREPTVLLTEGGDFDKLGRGFIWRGQIQPYVHQNHIFAVRKALT